MNNSNCNTFIHSRDSGEFQSLPDRQERTWQSDCDPQDTSSYTSPPAVAATPLKLRQCGFQSSAIHKDGTWQSDSDPQYTSSYTSPPAVAANAAGPRACSFTPISSDNARDAWDLMSVDSDTESASQISIIANAAGPSPCPFTSISSDNARDAWKFMPVDSGTESASQISFIANAAGRCTYSFTPISSGNARDAWKFMSVDSDTESASPISFISTAATPRPYPLPEFSRYSAQDVRQLMCDKDESVFGTRNPDVEPFMRAVLLNWMNELCALLKFHRETYFLAVDYFDRYLSKPILEQKYHLQLIASTCIFIAAKVEETHQPLVNNIAYLTYGVCQASDILNYEPIILRALDWFVTPVTPIGWLGIFMQMSENNCTRSFAMADNSISSSSSMETNTPVLQLSSCEFVQTAQLFGLCSLDVGILNYQYFVVAAAAISHTVNRETAIRCSTLDWSAIQSCALWMEPFFQVIKDHDDSPKDRSVALQQSDMIQTPFISMQMKNRVVSKMYQ